jgi:uncharacterized membrane protein YidH (DUF202 family)
MKTKPKQKLAQERTMLAKERTLMAWGRTGISAMAGAGGLGISIFNDFLH